MSGAVAARLADGRLHLQHGPIDLVILADAPPGRSDAPPAHPRRIARAEAAAWARFQEILSELMGEIDLLRAPVDPGAAPSGRVARRMAAAVAPLAFENFATPMAAVAGAVADEIAAVMRAAAPELGRIAVNNGGDVAIDLAAGARLALGIAGLDGARLGAAEIVGGDGIGGVATSGRGGRSLSFGIADSVTVLAGSAAAADAAATLIANAVDLPDAPEIRRARACDIRSDSDLGQRLVAIDCAPLTPADRAAALARGAAQAEAYRRAGRIRAAALHLQGATRLVGAERPRLAA